jgi:PhoPQ-activated pathogenicity-related protein
LKSDNHMSKLLSLSVFVFATNLNIFAAQSGPTALDRYVAAPDQTYEYKLVNKLPGRGYTTFLIEMTSQKWLTTNEVDRPTWTHWLLVTRPDTVETSTALLMIGGGSNDKGPPRESDPAFAAIATATKSVVAELRMIPNQPLVFMRDGQQRFEDDLIAYCWDKYLRTGDDRWPPRLPMTKAVVRAMDTITDICARQEGGAIKVNSFMITGGSKRGWTTWTTAAVDKRVVAIAPLVIDCLNVEPSFIHHFQTYGFYAPAVRDYEAHGIMNWQGTPEYRKLMEIVDPYEYRERFTMPKFIINATGDQFFLPDSSQFYFHDLPGPKYLRYVPNADHSLRGTDAVETIAACFQAVLMKSTLPRLSWEINGPTMRVRSETKPSAVKLWQATNSKARDFRLETIGKAWTSTDLSPGIDGEYLATVELPAKGWTAYLVELTYRNEGSQIPLKFTTEVKVVPETLPFKYEPKPHPNRPKN